MLRRRIGLAAQLRQHYPHSTPYNRRTAATITLFELLRLRVRTKESINGTCAVDELNPGHTLPDEYANTQEHHSQPPHSSSAVWYVCLTLLMPHHYMYVLPIQYHSVCCCLSPSLLVLFEEWERKRFTFLSISTYLHGSIIFVWIVHVEHSHSPASFSWGQMKG